MDRCSMPPSAGASSFSSLWCRWRRRCRRGARRPAPPTGGFGRSGGGCLASGPRPRTRQSLPWRRSITAARRLGSTKSSSASSSKSRADDSKVFEFAPRARLYENRFANQTLACQFTCTHASHTPPRHPLHSLLSTNASRHANICSMDPPSQDALALGLNAADPTTLVVDLNCAFASIEQQHIPELRGKVLAIAAYATDAATIVSSSREARDLGIRTGMKVFEAKA